MIPAFGPVGEVEQDGLDHLRRLVEGHVKALPGPGREDAAAYVNEEGLLEGLPYNARATRLLGIQIVGPAVLCGFDAARGDQTPIPADLAHDLLAATAKARSDLARD